MATLKLVAGGTSFDFLSGYIRINDGWTFGETLSESWKFTGKGTAANILSELNDLNEIIFNALTWGTDPLQGVATWLEFAIDAESVTRRRLVIGGNKAFLNGTGIDPMMSNQRVSLQIELEFAYSHWEEKAETTLLAPVNTSCLGGKLTLSPGGDINSRMVRVRLDDLLNPGLMTTFWMGVNNHYGVSPTDLVPVWKCSLGSNGTDASNVADADTVSGSHKRITFGTSSLQLRTNITYGTIITDASVTNSAHLRGRYLVLLRYKMPSTSTSVAVEMRYGLSGDIKATSDAIIISSGSGMSTYGLAEIGNVQFPPGTPRAAAGTDLSFAEISIYAERITGASNLNLGELILIPSDHMIRLTGATVGPSTGDLETTIYTHEDGEVAAYGYDLYPTSSARPEPENWNLPHGTGSIMVMVGAISTTESRLTDIVKPTIITHRCWQNYST